jgi:hypothetical protein
VGDKTVMRAQLELLAAQARTSRLAHDRDSVYVDTMVGTLYLDRPSDVTAANLVFDHLLVAALNSDESLAALAAAAEKYA